MKDNLLSKHSSKDQPDKQNISEMAQAKEALRQSEEQWHLMIESVIDFAIFKVTSDGLIASWNIGAERVFGFKESEIIGQPFDTLFTPEDRASGVPQKELETARTKGRADNDRWHVRHDGSRFFASGALTPLIGEAKSFVKIARDETKQLAAEKAARDNQILQKIVQAQEDERKRIARDLHDELGQQLVALRLKLEVVRKLCDNDKELGAKIDDVQTMARQIDHGVDFLAWELRPSVLDNLGLFAALQKYVKEWSQHSGTSADFITSTKKPMRLTSEAETNLYRIAQEALNNTHKHAKAKQVAVVLDKRGDSIVLTIEDDGVGFKPENKRTRSKGLGLMGMQERATLIGGSVEIESKPEKGTTIHVRVPIISRTKKSLNAKQ
jgi:PAS domain S-box-containing protein